MKYTVEPGRAIYRDGKPLVFIGRDRSEGLGPHEADALTRVIAKLLEENHDRLVCGCGNFYEAIAKRDCKTASLHKE